MRSYCYDELFTGKRTCNGGHFPDATQTIFDSLKSLSDDKEADNTDDDEEQPIDS